MGETPTKHAVVLICAVGEHETQCGDAWGQSGNWGAVQRRSMTAEERQVVLAGGKPPPRDPFEALHGDSSPVHGRYQYWFWQFPPGVVYPPAGLAGDDAGAWKMITGALMNDRPGRPSVRDVIDTATDAELADRMYARGYYEGFHDPSAPGGKEANVADYARAIGHARAEFEAGLAGWEPSMVDDGVGTVAEAQRILNAWGTHPRLAEDGVMGALTRDAVSGFQLVEGLTVDGVVGPQTWRALREFDAK
jgi:hypothetical protein